MLDNVINLNAWESLSDDLKAVIAAANGYANLFVMSEFVAKNNGALNTLVSEHGVILKKFPDDVMCALGTLSGEVMGDMAAAAALSREVMEYIVTFRKHSSAYAKGWSQAFYTARALQLTWIEHATAP